MIFIQLSHQLSLLRNLLTSIDNQQFTHCINHLGKASIGAHTRHIIELVQCAINGYANDRVDYINRQRDMTLEQDKQSALLALANIATTFDLADKSLLLVTEEVEGAAPVQVTTTYYREIVYNTEHTIHHLALIKVALIEMGLSIVSDDFGMAKSTLKYKAAQIQTT